MDIIKIHFLVGALALFVIATNVIAMEAPCNNPKGCGGSEIGQIDTGNTPVDEVDLPDKLPEDEDEKDNKKCCTCLQGEDMKISCDDLMNANNCSKNLRKTIFIKDVDAIPHYSSMICPTEQPDDKCEEHQFFIHAHGGPKNDENTGGGVQQFSDFLDGMKEICRANTCKKPITFNNNSCYSADAWKGIYDLCEASGLPDGCDFQFQGSQSMCFNDMVSKPLPHSAPFGIRRENGYCKLEFPDCGDMIGKECAGNNIVFWKLWKHGAEATCQDWDGNYKTMVCTRDSISSGAWTFK